MSTGVSVPNLDNLILASPSKSLIRVLQSIGRGLRLHEGKDGCTVYDIVDSFKHGKRTNFALKHSAERVGIYAAERFDFKIIQVKL